MKAFVTGGVIFLALASIASAQVGQTSFSLKDDVDSWLAADEFAAQPDPMGTEFTIGPTMGLLRAKDADKGVWFVGAQARLNIAGYFAVEGAVTFHQDKFLDGDMKVTQAPMQLSGLFYPFPDLKVKPYGLAGVGWYYTRTEFSGTLDGTPAETTNVYGAHLGAGAEIALGEKLTLNGDVRYIFLTDRHFKVDRDEVKEKEFDFWEITFGANIKF